MRSIDTTKDKARWTAEAKVLAELVQHHIDEEESDFLPAIEKEFARTEQEEMTEKFMNLRTRSQKGTHRNNLGVLSHL